MRDRLALGAAVIVLTLLSYFQFPGHTWLGSDTLIYVPMMEHIWDPSALTRDIVATKPHLSFTLYDEIAVALRWITRSSFKTVLIAQQFLFRALEIFGVYLIALSFPVRRSMALLVAAFFTLGATIVGPAVLVFEYEPVPRAFAVGLIFFAIGLAAQEHLMLADVAAALAFLYHPPTVAVFWALYLWYVLRHRDYRDLWPLAIGIVALFVSSRLQPGVTESQSFFTRVSADLEQLQRMRAGYNWISSWAASLVWQYVFLWVVALIAVWRVRPKGTRLFLIGMPTFGLLSIPLSYLLLDQLKWGLIPQVQPARASLFIVAFAVILGAAAGIRAAEARRWLESAAWFLVVFAIPTAPRLFDISARLFLIASSLAVGVACILYLQRFRWAAALLAVAAITPFFVIPLLGPVRNYRVPDFAAIGDLARFAKEQTPQEAIFLFADAGSSNDPSVFRAESLRGLYVDWKSGGQMNFHESLAREWWQRWQAANQLRFQPALFDKMQELPVDYLVLQPKNRPVDRQPLFENSKFVVYQFTRK